jgi:hypothetical protein
MEGRRSKPSRRTPPATRPIHYELAPVDGGSLSKIAHKARHRAAFSFGRKPQPGELPAGGAPPLGKRGIAITHATAIQIAVRGSARICPRGLAADIILPPSFAAGLSIAVTSPLWRSFTATTLLDI